MRPAFAAEPIITPPPALAPASVVVFNRPILTFRSPLLGMSPAQRAANASARVKHLLAAPGPHEITTERMAQGIIIKIDGQVALGITHEDADGLGPEAESATAADAVRKLTLVIGEMQEAHDPRALLFAALRALVATVIWFAVLWVLLRVLRGVRARILRYAEEKGAAMRAAGTEIVQRERVFYYIRVLMRGAFWVLAFLLTYQWLGYVLGRFPWTRPWGEGFTSFLIDTLLAMVSAVAGSLPGLVVVIVIFIIARITNGVLRNLFDGVSSGRLRIPWLDKDTVRPTRRLVTIAVWLFALAMAFPYIPGAETDAFKGVSVLLGLMVSVGASGIIGQAASGLILMYTRTFRPGEYVRIGDNEGTVTHLGMFTTRVRTGMGQELTLPNSMILAAVTKNYSRALPDTGFIVDASVTIGYDTPWRQVHAMLIEAAHRTQGVAGEPPPQVFQTALSDFYVEYRLVGYATPREPWPRAVVVSALHQSIQDVFNENGVQIMSPHYLGDPATQKVVPKADWYAPPAKPPG